jgi:predicted ATP-grasp superfamily ATP-dependent carboligase
VPAGVEFPVWCKDLPTAGAVLRAGAPVLSVFAQAPNPQLAQSQLVHRLAEVDAMLEQWMVAKSAGSLA